MEVELKLLLSATDVPALLSHRVLQSHALAAPREQHMRDVYLDTPDFLLARHGAGLRVRSVGHGWRQTFKAGGGVAAGLHSRHEWESELASPEPDLKALRAQIAHKSPWRDLLAAPALRRRLQTVFVTDLRRTVWDLRLPDGDEVEFVLDQGQLRSGERHAAVCEIEMELKSGDALHLYDLALGLLETLPLRLGNVSKAERGYRLSMPEPASMAVKARKLNLSRHMTVEQAFQAICANCLEQLQANEAGLVEAGDAESLHQMRVGLRRLRSAIGQFRATLPLPAALGDDIDWLAAQLGPARDWDVLAGATLPELAAALVEPNDYAELQAAAAQKTAQMHAAAVSAVCAPRYTGLLLGLTRWLQGRGWRDALAGAGRKRMQRLEAGVPALARSILDDDQRRLLRRGKKLRANKAGTSAEARHRVRIAAKKTRYATEFFQSLYRPKAVRRYVKALSLLQDELGRSNDAVVADRLLLQLPDGQADLQVQTAYARGFLNSRIASDDVRLRKVWRQFRRARAPA